MKHDKKLVYWGAGIIGNECLVCRPDVKPQFIIDSNWGTGCIHNIQVIKPDEVKSWDELFVVITSVSIEEIEILLNSKNLKRDQNYTNYKDFFGISGVSRRESLFKISDFIQKNMAFKNAIMIMAPVFASRDVGNLIRFFKEYGIKRSPQKCILFSHLTVLNETEAKRLIGYPVFDLSGINMEQDNTNNNMVYGIVLTEEEKKWILELEERKTYHNKEESYNLTVEMYCYLKKIFAIVNPKEVIIWGGWTRQNYILADIAEREGIPYGFMEHGWLAGTIQFDRGGISGQSEYAIVPSELYERDIEDKNIEMELLKDYIISQKLDTGKFRSIEDDETKLNRIDKKKKTVFFVGMDDYGIGINPQSDYWKTYVSSLFSSTQEAVFFIAKICKKNNWNLVFKPHPNAHNYNQIADERLKDSNIIQVKYTEIDRLIELADVVISIASAVDYKVLIYGKPLVQLGWTSLYNKGCSYEPNSLEVIEEQIKTAIDQGMTDQQNKNFSLHMTKLLDRYLWDDLSDRNLRYGLPLDIDFFDIGKIDNYGI